MILPDEKVKSTLEWLFSINVKTQFIEKQLQHLYEYFHSELVKLILYGHTKFKNDSVSLTKKMNTSKRLLLVISSTGNFTEELRLPSQLRNLKLSSFLCDRAWEFGINLVQYLLPIFKPSQPFSSAEVPYCRRKLRNQVKRKGRERGYAFSSSSFLRLEPLQRKMP